MYVILYSKYSGIFIYEIYIKFNFSIFKKIYMYLGHSKCGSNNLMHYFYISINRL